MANWVELSEEQRAAYARWLSERPEKIRAVAERFPPWKLYRLKDSGHRVIIVSISEPEDEADPITLRVAVTGEYNFVAFERQVFGVAPDSIEECDLPAPGELLGSADMSIEDVRAAMCRLEKLEKGN